MAGLLVKMGSLVVAGGGDHRVEASCWEEVFWQTTVRASVRGDDAGPSAGPAHVRRLLVRMMPFGWLPRTWGAGVGITLRERSCFSQPGQMPLQDRWR